MQDCFCLNILDILYMILDQRGFYSSTDTEISIQWESCLSELPVYGLMLLVIKVLHFEIDSLGYFAVSGTDCIRSVNQRRA